MGNRFGRFALLVALFIVGLLVAGIGTVLGADEVFKGEAGTIKATINDGKVIITQRNGDKHVKIGEIRMELLEHAISKEKREKVIQIALGDDRVRRLVGENYQVEVSPRVELRTRYIDGKLAVFAEAKGELYDVTFKTTWVGTGEAWMRTVETTVDLGRGMVVDVEVEEHHKPLSNTRKKVVIPNRQRGKWIKSKN